MKEFKKRLLDGIQVAAIALAISFGVSYLFAWTGPGYTTPGALPPTDNVPAPLNIGNNNQTKTGDICTTAPGGTGATVCLSSQPAGGVANISGRVVGGGTLVKRWVGNSYIGWWCGSPTAPQPNLYWGSIVCNATFPFQYNCLSGARLVYTGLQGDYLLTTVEPEGHHFLCVTE